VGPLQRRYVGASPSHERPNYDGMAGFCLQFAMGEVKATPPRQPRAVARPCGTPVGIRGTQGTGESIEVRGCDLFEFTDGKISRKDSFWKIVD
jgi:hypothetical protein